MVKKTLTGSRSIDWITMSLYLSLLIIGWFMLYAAVYDENNPYGFFDLNTPIGKQTLWVGISLFVFICSLVLDWKFWNTFAYPIYIIGLLSLVGVLFLGTEIKGARSWYVFGGLSFQPAEIVKFATALALASYLSFYKSDVRSRNTFLTSLLIIGLPIILIFLQPDAGSAIVFVSFSILLFRNGLSPFYFILAFSLAAIFIFSLMYSPIAVVAVVMLTGLAFLILDHSKTKFAIPQIIALALIVFFLFTYEKSLWAIILMSVAYVFAIIFYLLKRNARLLLLVIPSVLIAITFSYGSSFAFENGLEPHQQDRINVWLRPHKCDPRGSLYNIIQSKLAIGSGGFEGKGFLKGEMTKLNYVPEQTTDFIFSTVGEEQGFIGSVGIIIIFTLLLIRITVIAERAKNEFIRNYAYGVAGIIFIHFFINIAMSMGLMPVIGIPLPFLSKGGSALLGFTLMIGVLLKMDLARFR